MAQPTPKIPPTEMPSQESGINNIISKKPAQNVALVSPKPNNILCGNSTRLIIISKKTSKIGALALKSGLKMLTKSQSELNIKK